MPLPEIAPTQIRNLKLPDYTVRIHENQDGLEKRRVITESGRETDITVFYDHLNEEQTLEFIEAYEESVPSNRGFGLPNSILQYPDILFQEVLDLLGQVLFYFRKAPRIVTNKVGGSYSVILYLTAKEIIFNAPSEVLTILSTSVTLSVETTVPFVKWEQLSGQELIIESPFEPTTKVTAAAGNITNVLGQIVVRVSLIDNPLIYQDVSINARPTDTVDSTTLTVSAYGSYLQEFGEGYNVLAPIRWELSSPLGQIELNENDGAAFNPLQIYWYDPQITEFLVGFDIEYFDGSNWYVVFSQVAGDYNYAQVAPNQTFRIVAKHLINGNAEYRAPSDKVFNINPLTASGDIITASDSFPSVKSESTFFIEEDLLPDFLLNYYEDTPFSISHKSESTFFVTESTPFEKLDISLEEERFDRLTVASTFTIMVETDTDLGGGQIG